MCKDNRSRVVAFLIAIIAVATLTVGCAEQAVSSRSITDMGGDVVELPTTIDRVVSTSDPCTAMMLAFGLGSKLVGVYETFVANPWVEVFWPEAADVVTLDTYEPEAESLIAENVDLVFVPTSERAEALREKGICAVCIRYYTPEEVVEAAQLLGEIFGGETEKISREWIADYEDSINTVESLLADVPESERPVVYEIMGDKYRGLFRTNYGMAQGWLAFGGGQIATRDLDGVNSSAALTEESILKTNPEVIFIGGPYAAQLEDDLYADSKWSDIPAVQNHQVYPVPVGASFWNSGSAEYPLMVYYVYSKLYPQQNEVDLATKTRDFYEKYYGITLDEEQLSRMIDGLSPSGETMRTTVEK